MTYAEATSPTRQRGLLTRVAGVVLRHRRWVIAFWLLVLVAGAAGAGTVSKRLTVDFSLPGQPGYESSVKVDHLYGSDTDNGFVTVFSLTAPSGTTVAQSRARLAGAFDKVAATIPKARVADYGNTGDPRLVGRNGRTTVGLLVSPPPTSFSGTAPGPAQRQVLQTALPGWTVGVTGLQQLASGSSSGGPGVLAETLLGAAGALVVLAIVFASLLALVPLMIAAVSILTTLLLVLALTTVTDVSFIVQFLVALVGLGIGIDYSLLIVTRWREERDRGADNHDAVVRAVETAGHTVAVSGVTVAIGLLALVVLPVPSLRSVGYGGVLIPIASIAVTLTLLPALLGGIGPRVDWPRLRHERKASRFWSGWARLVVRRRWLAAGAAIVALGLFAAPVANLTVGQTSVAALAKSGPARAAYDQVVAQGITPGVLTPMEVLTTDGARSRALQAATSAAGVTTAVVPSGSQWSRAGTADILVLPDVATVNSQSLGPVTSLSAAVDGIPGVLGATGAGYGLQDFSHAVYGTFPLMLGIIALITLVLLMRAFRSVLLAVKAVVLNLVSLAATFGIMTFFWQQGHGSEALFGIAKTGAITIWIPLMVFAFLFGLSMDYEVFILSRIREEYDGAHDPQATGGAVVQGVGRTGRLVTSAALILFLAFAALASAPDTDLKVLATGLGVGILLDATIVRALLVPALMALFGRWNWWLPRPVAKVLRVAPST